ncbi:hypothetical protein ATO8_06556 [Roseivivax marinus]|uniref:Peptidase M23 n=1 Tax=Roseivivax marinus TaxID=1379903 RepID=W4HNT3_9RHOB|nr:hypothetical protein [Roseivivax marinus]ETW13670.1 hypothetical protein ATO8_06556 [Roseivivax marinus]
MTRFSAPAAAALTLLAAVPAEAHTGAHLHPHAGVNWLAVAGVLAIFAAAVAVLLRERGPWT